MLECVCVDSVPSCVYEFVKFLKSDGGGVHFGTLSEPRGQLVLECVCIDSYVYV